MSVMSEAQRKYQDALERYRAHPCYETRQHLSQAYDALVKSWANHANAKEEQER